MSFVFIDTEFTDFHPMELMSIGAVTEDGAHEFYVEITDHNPNLRSGFVQQVVVPLMDFKQFGMTYVDAGTALRDWLDSLPYDRVTIVVDYVGDSVLFTQLLAKTPPSKPIDTMMLNYALAHMLHSRGIHTTDGVAKAYDALMKQTSKYFDQDPRQHHALVDAKANRHGWLAAYEAGK